ncbi:hypothetical protein MQM1_021 [Aeromonas phage vB_AsaP_MQM1]|nr:hypothetical protein MQM1_021 [Aeromonas phage vB_AsaP_MQM1]
MAFNIGEAIAMGITQGIGSGAGQVFQQKREDRLQKEAELREESRWQSRFKQQSESDQKAWEKREAVSAKTRATETATSQKFQVGREDVAFQRQAVLEGQRQRFEVGRIAAATQESKKLSIFQQNLQYIGSNMNKMKAFQTYGKMDVGQIAQQLALEAAKGAPTKLQQQVFQDTMSRFHGMSKQELLGQANLIPQDLSEFANNPEYKGAIPKGYIAGIQQPQQGMDQVFQYTPPAQETGSPTIQMYEKRLAGYTEIAKAAPSLVQRGIKITGLDPAVSNQIDTLLGQGDKTPAFVDQTTGMPVNRVDDFIVEGLQQGTLVYDQATGKLTTPDAANQRTVFNIAQEEAHTPPTMLAKDARMTPQGTQQEAPVNPVRDPAQALAGAQTGQQKLAEQIQFRKDTKEFKELEKSSESLSKEIGESGVLKMTESAGRALESITTATPDVQKKLFSAFADADGDVATSVRTLGKATNPEAKAAYLILQDLQATQNSRILTLGGKAVSTQEAERFKRELGQAGVTGSLAELKKGLTNIIKMGQDEVAANLEGSRPELQELFFERAPLYRKMMEEHSVYGTEEGKSRAAERTQARTEAQALLEQGASPAEVSQYLQEEYGITLD